MEQALELARRAGADGEVPVGALVVRAGIVVAAGHNRCERERDPLAHAELVALRGAFRALAAGRLPDCDLFCTIEPCIMCTGAALHARVRRIVFAARDPKFGACRSLYDLPADPRLNHRCEVVEGPLAAESAALMRDFFRRRRPP
jgi:tRNA(adenine34) deaminase